MSVHWLVSLTRRSVFPGVDDVAIPPGASHTEAWRILAEATGRPQEELAATIARVFRTEVADFASAEPTATKLLPGSIAVETGVFPLTYRDRYLTVATSNPTDVAAEQEIAFASGRKPRFHIAPPGTLHQHIHAAYRLDKAAEALLTTVDAHMATMVEIVEEEGPESLPAEESATGPVVRLTNVILHEAIHRNASDIHIQPKGAGGIVRYRVDGVLQEGMELPLPVLTRVVSRIKVMSQLDITDRLRPQDGRARISVDGRKYDLRVSTVPTRVAEKAVIRVLDSQGAGTLDDSGIPAEELVRIRRALANRDGIFVVTGPTGSGKTTTLYGALRELSTDDVNIMTVEDPVEYELPGLTQIQVESKQGMTFGSALRAILRQDPDIIFVGEIRDAETAHIAAQASLTGHLVLATLHTNDAVGAIRRFIDLGLDPTTVSETLRGTIAQRLVRRLCDQCVQPVGNDPTPEEIELSKRFHVRPGNRAVGCEACRGQGYRGRLPVVEFLAPSTAFQRLVQQDASPLDILEQATRDGMRTLVESALDRVRSGETSLDEVARVIGEVAEGAEGWMGSAPQRHEPAAAAAVSNGSAGPAPAARTVPSNPSRTSVMVDADDESDAAGLDSPRILVVDDDGTNRTIARGLLEKEGFQVAEASDGSDALSRLSRGDKFSLILLDLDMPMLGGREVLRAVRQHAATAQLPVIVLTGTPDLNADIELLENGADDFIRKPIDPPRLVPRVKATLRRAMG